jgi:prolyl oligopeptidase
MSLRSTVVLLLCAAPVAAQQSYVYPKTAKVDLVEDYHGTKVADPYRWMEQDTAQAVGAWVEAQNGVTGSYLRTVPFRADLRRRLGELNDYAKASPPEVVGAWQFYRRNSGLQNQSVLFRRRGESGAPEMLIDPNTLSTDGTTRLQSTVPNRDASLLAFTLSRSGSDWQEIRVMDLATKQWTDDRVQWVKVSGIAWWKDGFFYSRYPTPADTAVAYSSRNENHQVWYHTLGTLQSADRMIFEDAAHPLRFHTVGTTESQRYAVLNISDGASGRPGDEIWVRDLDQPGSEFVRVVEGFESNASVIDNDGSMLLVRTNRGAPNYRVVRIDPSNPAESAWREVIPEQKSVLQGVATAGGRLLAQYLVDVKDEVRVFRYDGTFERDVALPGAGSTGGWGADAEAGAVYFSFTGFLDPATIYRYEIATGAVAEVERNAPAFDRDAYEVLQVFVTSKDGTKIPMYLIKKKTLKADGTNPTLVYAYGGFNISLSPSFNPSMIALLEQGVIYAQPNLRGGGEYGESWHQAGTKARKQNVFDDFVASAEWLVANKWTSSAKLAISGGSNGGLLVGATMTQRPDLVKVALPAVGVMDMLRFQKFTIGFNWIDDYGTSDDKDGFAYLRAYSPLHNLKPGTTYPSTMVTTADHDDRVVPAHSFKFAATLQAAHAGRNPVLIRIETKSGHGASSLTKRLDEQADVYGFMLKELGAPVKIPPAKGRPAA